jgi:hypothetical protein
LIAAKGRPNLRVELPVDGQPKHRLDRGNGLADIAAVNAVNDARRGAGPVKQDLGFQDQRAWPLIVLAFC